MSVPVCVLAGAWRFYIDSLLGNNYHIFFVQPYLADCSEAAGAEFMPSCNAWLLLTAADEPLDKVLDASSLPVGNSGLL